MNLILDKILKDIQRIKIEGARENNDKKIEPKKVISIKKNESIENFMKFQWTWTM